MSEYSLQERTAALMLSQQQEVAACVAVSRHAQPKPQLTWYTIPPRFVGVVPRIGIKLFSASTNTCAGMQTTAAKKTAAWSSVNAAIRWPTDRRGSETAAAAAALSKHTRVHGNFARPAHTANQTRTGAKDWCTTLKGKHILGLTV